MKNASTNGRSRPEVRSVANARWERLYDKTYDKYGGRYGLCQWEDEDDSGEFLGRRCTRRTTSGVYCWRHDRQLEREAAKRRRDQGRAATSPLGTT